MFPGRSRRCGRRRSAPERNGRSCSLGRARFRASSFRLPGKRQKSSLAGASVQRTCEDSDGNVEGTIHLAFWRRCLPDGESEEAERDARRRLTILIDSAFETMDGLQGWIARWDWIPRFTMAEENNYTPYEDAYAMGSPSAEPEDGSGGYMDVKWCRRHLARP